MSASKFLKIILVIIALIVAFLATQRVTSKDLLSYFKDIKHKIEVDASATTTEEKIEAPVEEKKMSHVKTPENVRGIYVSANSFLYKPFLERLDKMIEETTINTIVVDIKDAPGVITYDIGMQHPCIQPLISKEDLEAKLDYYHKKNIYVIARIAVFRDECFTKQNLDLASKKADGTPWRDGKGNYWLSPSKEKTAQYIVDLAKNVYDRGFDEIQLDYVRYPSDGQMNLLSYEYNGNFTASSTGADKRRQTLGNFLAYVRKGLEGIPLSADVFGMVLTNTDDLTIGQHLDEFVQHVDYISGMIYPSHFPNNWNGIKLPNKAPYQTIYDSTKMGLDRVTATHGTSTAYKVMRPWLQDFSIFGVDYNAPEVKAQIKALDDLGVKSYLLWNASNRYTPGVIDRE